MISGQTPDTGGPVLHVKVHAANIHDTVAGGPVFEGALKKYPSLKGVCADAGYRKTMEEFVTKLGRKIEISERIKPGWEILPKRWVVERTFGWLNGFRGYWQRILKLPSNQQRIWL
ncbi:hypothetical protein FACS1894152_8380 [Bacilli bacterium]|nr:hypothetical protein FACS1894152_8380 [Bacilli bacterium]